MRKKRPHDPENTYAGFRPRCEQEAAYFCIKKWCEHPRVNKTLSAVINSLLDGVKAAIENTTQINPKTGEITVEINLGRITIK